MYIVYFVFYIIRYIIFAISGPIKSIGGGASTGDAHDVLHRIPLSGLRGEMGRFSQENGRNEGRGGRWEPKVSRGPVQHGRHAERGRQLPDGDGAAGGQSDASR